MKSKSKVTSQGGPSLWSVGVTIGITCALILIVPQALAFTRRLVTRFCYTSPNTAQILLLACTGSTALTNNMTATHALCVINSCFGQVQQVPSFSGGIGAGKKKRDVSEENTVVKEEVSQDENTAEEGSQSSALEEVKIVKSVHVHLDLDYKDEDEDFMV